MPAYWLAVIKGLYILCIFGTPAILLAKIVLDTRRYLRSLKPAAEEETTPIIEGEITWNPLTESPVSSSD